MMKDYYVQIFSSETEGHMADTLDAVECKVTTQMNDVLTRPFSVDEVIRALKQLHQAKAPGPDGMTPLFFQKYWSIVKTDVLEAVFGILNLGHDPTYLNYTHIVLIPKVKTPLSPKDFRPISLCNVIFRILTKTIANRLKEILSEVISESQRAFIQGRMITDNAMCAFEIFHSMKNKKNGKKRDYGYETRYE